MARLDLAKARQLGYSDQQIQQYAQQKGVQLYDSAQKAPQAQPEQPRRNLIESLLPAGGSIVGGIGGALLGGPVGGVAGATAGGGVGELIAQLLNQEKTDFGKAAKEAGYGTLGEVTGLGLGRLLGPVISKGVSGTEQALSRSVVNPMVKASPTAAKTEKTIMQTLKDLGISGSAKSQYDQLEPAIKDIGTQVSKKLSARSKPVNTADILTVIDDAISKVPNFDDTLPAYQKAKDKFINQILSKANANGKNGLTVTYKDIFEAKQNLGNQLSKSFGKSTLTPAEETGLAIWESLDNLLPKDVQKLTRTQSILYRAAPGLKKSRDTATRVPILGEIPGINRPLQAGASRGAELLSALQNKSVVGATQRGSGQAIARTLFPSDEGSNITNSQDIIEGEFGPAGEPMMESGSDATSALSDPETLKKLAILDLVANGGENISKINTLITLLAPKASESQAKIQSLNNSVDLLMKNYESAGGAQGAGGLLQRALGSTPGVRSLGINPQAQVFEDQRRALIAPLARAISGEVGVLTDQDIKRAEGLLPRLSDPPEVAQAKISDLMTLINQAGSAGTPDSGILQTGSFINQ